MPILRSSGLPATLFVVCIDRCEVVTFPLV